MTNKRESSVRYTSNNVGNGMQENVPPLAVLHLTNEQDCRVFGPRDWRSCGEEVRVDAHWNEVHAFLGHVEFVDEQSPLMRGHCMDRVGGKEWPVHRPDERPRLR